MRHRSHLSAAERSARSKLAKIAHEEPVLCGSLVHMKRQCGNPTCKCTRGERHESLCLAIQIDGKRKMFHVPRQLETRVTESVKNYQEMKALMKQASQGCLDRFLAEKDQLISKKKKK